MLVVTWCEARFFFNPADVNIHKITRITFLYSGFAFVISLIREAIKDMEDIEGDRRYGCKTMPIVWGFNASKIYVAIWMTMLIHCFGIDGDIHVAIALVDRNDLLLSS